jgi:endonuclease/exonuclease/phosphatase family metal-dependent hydrolase
MVKKRFYFAVMLPIIVLLAGCSTKQNYDQPDAPRFEGHYAEPQANFDGALKVVTWNIKLSQEIDAAVTELVEAEALRDADILLLQEMDEIGAEAIAQSLEYNYVYFPASVNTRHDRNVGNAILSKWPITEAERLLLPFENPVDQEKRVAARALLAVDGREVVVYSVHTETAWLGQAKRMAQFDTILEDINDRDRHVIIGGDFNTALPSNVTKLERRFAQAGLVRISTDTGPTFQLSGLGLTLDHIFTKGLSVQLVETTEETPASDHLPVAATLNFEPDLGDPTETYLPALADYTAGDNLISPDAASNPTADKKSSGDLR